MAAADTNSPGYARYPSEGVRPLCEPEWFYDFEDDCADLSEVNDKWIVLPVAKGATVLDAFMDLGDHDTNVTPLCKHDLVVKAAVDGNAAAAFNVIDASTVGQAGGLARAGTGTAPVTSVLGKRIEANGATVYVQTDAAPATAATASRKVLVAVLVGNYPLSPVV